MNGKEGNTRDGEVCKIREFYFVRKPEPFQAIVCMQYCCYIPSTELLR